MIRDIYGIVEMAGDLAAAVHRLKEHSGSFDHCQDPSCGAHRSVLRGYGTYLGPSVSDLLDTGELPAQPPRQ